MSRKGRHHSGPVKVELIFNKRARQKSFSKRKESILKKDESLHKICGATVHLTIVSETGISHQYHSNSKRRRTCATQFGETTMPEDSHNLRSQETTTVHTPKKIVRKKRQYKEDLPSAPFIKNLPGKRKHTPSKENSAKKITGKCKICGVIWESKVDTEFRKNVLDRLRQKRVFILVTRILCWTTNDPQKTNSRAQVLV